MRASIRPKVIILTRAQRAVSVVWPLFAMFAMIAKRHLCF